MRCTVRTAVRRTWWSGVTTGTRAWSSRGPTPTSSTSSRPARSEFALPVGRLRSSEAHDPPIGSWSRGLTGTIRRPRWATTVRLDREAARHHQKINTTPRRRADRESARLSLTSCRSASDVVCGPRPRCAARSAGPVRWGHATPTRGLTYRSRAGRRAVHTPTVALHHALRPQKRAPCPRGDQAVDSHETPQPFALGSESWQTETRDP